MEIEQELADVPGRIGHGAGVVIGQVEHLAVLGLERMGAGRRGAHDPVAGPGEGGQRVEVAPRLATCVVVHPVADERQAAALLLGHDDIEAVALEDGHRVPAKVGLEPVHRAAVEVDDGALRIGSRRKVNGPIRSSPPCAERAARERGERAATVDAEGLLPHPAREAVAQAEVGKRRQRVGAQPDEQVGVADEPVADRGAALGDDRRACPVVRLRDEDPGRTGARADPAARAQVDGAVRRAPVRRGAAEALRLRADVLGPGEGIGHAADRTHSGAHVALDAGVGAEGRELPGRRVREGHAAARPRARARAARWAVARATPSPHRSSR